MQGERNAFGDSQDFNWGGSCVKRTKKPQRYKNNGQNIKSDSKRFKLSPFSLLKLYWTGTGYLRQTWVGRLGSSTGRTGRLWSNPCGTLHLVNQTNTMQDMRLASFYSKLQPNCTTSHAKTLFMPSCVKSLRCFLHALCQPLNPPNCHLPCS